MDGDGDDAQGYLDLLRALDESDDLLSFVVRARAPFVAPETTKYTLCAVHLLACETDAGDAEIQTVDARWTRALACVSFREFSNSLAFSLMCATEIDDRYVRGALWLAQMAPGRDPDFDGVGNGGIVAWNALCAAFCILHFIAVRRELDQASNAVEADAALERTYDRYVAALSTTRTVNISGRSHAAIVRACTPFFALSQYTLSSETSTPLYQFRTPAWVGPVGLLSTAVGNEAIPCDNDVVQVMFGTSTFGWRAPLHGAGRMQLALATLVISNLREMVIHGAYTDPSSVPPVNRDAPMLYLVGARVYLFGARGRRAYQSQGTAFMHWRAEVREYFRVREGDGVSPFE